MLHVRGKQLMNSLVPTILFAAWLWAPFAAANTPETFSFQGVLSDSTGAPSGDRVKFKLQILAPNGCLLYEEETGFIELANSEGRFSVSVGSPVVSSKRTANDPKLAMRNVYNNNPLLQRPAAANCPNGYSPASGDRRKLRVTVIGPSGNDVLSPDQTLEASPFAITAQTLQGKEPGDFVQISNSITQSIINDLAAGSSNLYLRADGSNLTSALSANSQRVINVAAPSAGTDAVNKNYADARMAGREVDSAVPSNGQVLVWNAGSSKWVASSPTDASVQPHARATNPGCTASEASRWNGSAWSCLSLTGGGGGGAGGGAVSYTTATGNIVLSSTGTKINDFRFTEGGTVTLPDATTLATGGSHFTLMNSTSDPLPILNSNGMFLNAVNSGASTDVFLFNNGTVGGDWRFSNNGANFGISRYAIDSGFSEKAQYVLFDYLSSSKFLVVAALGAPDNKITARIADINTSTETVHTWGGQIDVASSTNSLQWARVLSPTQALVMDNSNIHLLTLNSGSNSVSLASTTASGGSCNGGRAINGAYYCWSGQNIYKYSISGTTVTQSSVYVGFDIVSLEGFPTTNYAFVLGQYNNGSGYEVKTQALDLTTMTMQGTPGTINTTSYSSMNTNNLWNRPTFPLSSTAVISAVKTGESVVRIYKFTADGGYNLTNTPGPELTTGYMNYMYYFEYLNSNLYLLTQGMNGDMLRYSITNPSTMTLGASSKSAHCQTYRYGLGKCLDITTRNSKPAVRFEIGL